MPYYIIHVVKHWTEGLRFHEQGMGRWLNSVRDDFSAAEVRTQQLNEGLHLPNHHHYEVSDSLVGVDGPSEIADEKALAMWEEIPW